MRSPQSQALHHLVVTARAEQLRRDGNRVWADVSGFARPLEIFGYFPDIIAEGTSNLISEVETSDSYASEHTKQKLQAFDSIPNYLLEVVVPESV